MSMTISMSFFPSKGKTIKAFISILRRLIPNSEVHQVIKYKQYQGDNREKLDIDTLISILESPDSQLIANSQDSFCIHLGYTLTSGESIPINLHFYGKYYNIGHTFRNDSSLQITTQDSDLWSSLKQLSRNKYRGEQVAEHLIYEAEEKINKDSEVLFLKACGLLHISAV